MKKYTFKIYPAGRCREAYRVIEMAGEKTLENLCEYILECFDFTDEHLYEFCMDNKMYSEYSYEYNPEDDDSATVIKIDKIGLVKGQNFSLHYDYGDDWMFTIHVNKIEETNASVESKLIKSKGKVEQYPSWEDWEILKKMTRFRCRRYNYEGEIQMKAEKIF